MNQDDITFEMFLAARMKEKNISIKKLSELTGVAPSHIENMLRGNLEGLPSAPYFRGYLMRIGDVLDFDGEEWWERTKKEGVVKKSGAEDSLPKNRFVKKSSPKWLWPSMILAVILVIYFATELPHVLGKPALTIDYPAQNPFTTTSSTITFEGVVGNADSLYLNGASIPFNADGSWQENVLLQDGVNSFEVVAKKFLGRETAVTEQVFYQPPLVPSAPPTNASSSIAPSGL